MKASTKSRTSQVTAIAGANDGATERLGPAEALPIWRGLALKLAVLVAVMAAVPIIIYFQVRDAEINKRDLLLAGVVERGELVSRGLQLVLRQDPDIPIAKVKAAVETLAGPNHRIKVFFRPREKRDDNAFFYITSVPAVANDYLERERKNLIGTGIFHSLRDSCGNNDALALRYVNPEGHQEVLTSVTSLDSERGCWAVVTSHITGDLVGSWIDRPFWNSPEVKLAATIYAAMAIVVLGLFLGVWRSLERFARVARVIRSGVDTPVQFRSRNRIPELKYVAEEFDHMVDALRDSAQAIRNAAEENAHAFKTPIATIAQSVEPLRRSIPPGDSRAHRAIEVIEKSVARLDSLVTSARRMEETIAELVDPPRERVDLSRLVQSIVRAYGDSPAAANVRIVGRVESGLIVVGGDDLLETVIENLVDNATDFSPAGGQVTITLQQRERVAELCVEDEGPGVPTGELDRIFERYYSARTRPTDGPQGDASPYDSEHHFGIGLWIVRRNVRAIGGDAFAENRAGRGLRVVVAIPRA